MMPSIALAVIVGGLICYLLGRFFIQLAHRTGLALDEPGRDPRRIHRQPTPRVGGPALLIAFLCTLAIILPPEFWRNQQIQGLILGSLLIALLGIVDDVRNLSGPVKLAGQAAIISFVVLQFDLLVPYVNNPLGSDLLVFPPLASALISIVWIMVTTNTLNFIDGIDGLATSIAICFSFTVCIVALLFNQLELTLILATLLGCSLGIFPLNRFRARTFLGDSGAMFLGFCIGTLSILSGAKLATTLLVLGLPILDVLNTFVMRLRRGQSLFTADNEHLHYRLIRKGLTTNQTVLTIAGISLGFGLLALVNNTTFKVIALILLGIVSQGLILWSMQDGKA
jgi:UDP-GlcNAc:undecaprenyl-phosphate GlcNAc-1-phosphate transferase